MRNINYVGNKMSVSDKTDRIVDGFCYVNKEEAQLAVQENDKIEILTKKMEGCDLASAKAVYERAILNRTFRTPVGHKFLYSLRNKLIAKGVPEESLSPIPLQVHFIQMQPLESYQKKEVKPVANKKQKPKVTLVGSVILNVILLIAIMAMFIITLYSDNPNIINYKTQVQNEYATWDQELKEKEKQLRIWEKELNDKAAIQSEESEVAETVDENEE